MSHLERHRPRTSMYLYNSSRQLWYAIGLLSVVNVFNYMDRMALAVLLPLIKVDLQLSDGQLGLLMGFSFSLFYAVCGIPIARLADRGSRRNIIALALATWSVMTALSGAAQNFWHLFAARVALGAGEAGCAAPSQSLICDYVPFERRSGVFAIHTFGLIMGMMLGMTLAGWLGDVLGWRWTFVVLGLPGVALAALVRLTLREPVRGAFDAVKDSEISWSLNHTISFLWRSRTFRLLICFGVANGFLQYGLNQWWPSFYARVFGLSLSSVGAYLGFALGVGSGMGLLIGGGLANKLAPRDVRLPLKIGAAAVALALPAALASLFVTSPITSILLVSLTTLLWSVPAGPMTSALYSVVPARARATAGAVSILFSAVLGFGLGPFCVGELSDLLTPSMGNRSLRYALLLPISLLPVLVVLLYASARALPHDLRAVEGFVEQDSSAKRLACRAAT